MRPRRRPASRPAHRRACPAPDPEAGVTLVEMMVVLVIIAIVAVMVVPQVIGRPDQARVTVTTSDIRAISSALEMYRLDNLAYPSTAQGLEALVVEPSMAPRPANWNPGGYLDAVPVDAWGNPYVYRSPGESGAFDVVSLGADGRPGGDGIAADLDNHAAPR